MIEPAVVLAILALVFGALGFTGIASGFAFIAKILFIIILVGLLFLLLVGVGIFSAVT